MVEGLALRGGGGGSQVAGKGPRRVGYKWRNYPSALLIDWEGKFGKRGKGEVPGINQGAEIDAKLFDDVALHLNNGDFEQDLLPALHRQHVDDIGPLTARRKAAATVLGIVSGIDAHGRAAARGGTAATLVLVERSQKACDDFAGATRVNGIDYGTREHHTIADRPNLDMRGRDELIKEVTQGA